MLLKKIQIINYRNINNFTLDIPDKNDIMYITAPIGSGKTAVLEAVSTLLSGKFCNDAIGKNGPRATLRGFFDDGNILERSICTGKRGFNRECKINGVASSLESCTKWLYEHGIHESDYRVLLNPRAFSELTPVEQTQFILGQLSFTMSLKSLIKIAKFDIEEEIMLTQKIGDLENISLDMINQLYNEFYDERKVLKAECQILKEKLNDSVPRPLKSIEELDTQLKTITSEEVEYENHLKAIRNYEAAVSRIETIKKQIDENKNLLSDLESVTEVSESEMDAVRKLVASIDERIRACRDNVQMLKREVSINESLKEKLLANKCPLSDKITCQTDKTSMIDDISVIINAAKSNISKGEIDIENAESEKKDAAERLKSLEYNQKQWEKKLSILKEIKFLQDNMPELPDKPKTVEKVDFALKIESINRQRRLVILYEEQENNRRILKEKEMFLTIKNNIVEALKPKGIVRCAIIKQVVDKLQDFAKKRLNLLNPEYDIRIEMDEVISFMCKTEESEQFRPFQALSGGEKICFSVVIFNMLRQLTDGKILILDDLDRLDADAFRKLSRMIGDISGEYNTIICGFVEHEDLIKAASESTGKVIRLQIDNEDMSN